MVVGRGPTLDSRSDADAGLTRKRIHSQVKMEAFASLNASVFNFSLRISACGSSHARYDNDMALAQAFVKGSSHQQHHTHIGTYRKQDGGDASTTRASRSFPCRLLTHDTHPQGERQASRPSTRLVTMGTMHHFGSLFLSVIKTTNLEQKRLRN